MPKEVFNHTTKECKKDTTIGLLATEGTIKTGVYNMNINKLPNEIIDYIYLFLPKESTNKCHICQVNCKYHIV